MRGYLEVVEELDRDERAAAGEGRRRRRIVSGLHAHCGVHFFFLSSALPSHFYCIPARDSLSLLLSCLT